MTSILAIRDMLALQGRMESKALSQRLNASHALVVAMLERMEALGKVTRIIDEGDGCLSGSCRGCPEGKNCRRELWALKEDIR